MKEPDGAVPIKVYVDQRFADQQKAVEATLAQTDLATKAALASAEKAVDKSERNVERWQTAANEWRAAMSDRERDFLTRKEFYSMIAAGVAVFALLSRLGQ